MESHQDWQNRLLSTVEADIDRRRKAWSVLQFLWSRVHSEQRTRLGDFDYEKSKLEIQAKGHLYGTLNPQYSKLYL